MSMPNVKCLVCGGVEFTVDAGSFFCLECNTQSQVNWKCYNFCNNGEA